MVLLDGPPSGFVGAYLPASGGRADRQQPALQALRILFSPFTLKIIKEYPQASPLQEVLPQSLNPTPRVALAGDLSHHSIYKLRSAHQEGAQLGGPDRGYLQEVGSAHEEGIEVCRIGALLQGLWTGLR